MLELGRLRLQARRGIRKHEATSGLWYLDGQWSEGRRQQRGESARHRSRDQRSASPSSPTRASSNLVEKRGALADQDAPSLSSLAGTLTARLGGTITTRSMWWRVVRSVDPRSPLRILWLTVQRELWTVFRRRS